MTQAEETVLSLDAFVRSIGVRRPTMGGEVFKVVEV